MRSAVVPVHLRLGFGEPHVDRPGAGDLRAREAAAFDDVEHLGEDAAVSVRTRVFVRVMIFAPAR